MTLRLEYWSIAPEEYHALLAVLPKLKAGLGETLVNLLLVRISQINGCAFCVDTHCSHALRNGESQRRLNSLAVWRETPFYSAPERAALAWSERLTRISEPGPLEDLYEDVRAHFPEKQTVILTLTISLMNALNRLAIGFGRTPAPEDVSASVPSTSNAFAIIAQAVDRPRTPL